MIADEDSHFFIVPDEIRWDEPMVRAFSEIAPYQVEGTLRRILGRKIEFEAAGTHDQIGSQLMQVVHALARDFRDASEKLVRSGSRETPNCNAYPLLSERGEIVETSPGSFAYRGGFAKVISLVDEIVRRFAVSLAASEEQYPTTISRGFLKQVGYLSLFPQHLFFSAPLQKTKEGLSSVSYDPLLELPSTVLNATVCHHTFQVRKGQTLETPELVTALGSCNRYEAGNFVDGIRLSNFRMREIVCFGTESDVAGFLDACVSWFEVLVTDLDLNFNTVEAIDPFFGESGGRRVLQAGLSLKTEIRLPVCSDFVAVASANNHRQSFSRSLGISARTGEPVSSGCFGLGLDRMALALFDRYGPIFDQWEAHPGRILSKFADFG